MPEDSPATLVSTVFIFFLSLFSSNQYERHKILQEKPHIKTSTSASSGFRLSALGYTFTRNAVENPLYFAYTFRMPQ